MIFADLADRRQRLQARIGHRHAADIGLDRAERIIGRLRRRRRGQGVEQGRFADIGQTDDAAIETHQVPPVGSGFFGFGAGTACASLVMKPFVVAVDQQRQFVRHGVQQRLQPVLVGLGEIAAHSRSPVSLSPGWPMPRRTRQ